nr:TetR/AcrR family transcriptional regulator [uncultured Cupriavidus sp.]
MVRSTESRQQTARTGRRPPELQRAEQARAQETRTTILDAALTEFASKGFEAASIRSIADRIGVQHPLITYHYRTKDILWEAVAVHAFDHIRHEWEGYLADPPPVTAVEQVKLMYRALFRFTVAFPELHHFMLREIIDYSPRLQWLADTILRPLIDRMLPQIREAQTAGDLPMVDPVLLHYMMISMTSTLSTFGAEMRATSNVSASEPDLANAFWDTVEVLVFGGRQRVGRNAGSSAGKRFPRK